MVGPTLEHILHATVGSRSWNPRIYHQQTFVHVHRTVDASPADLHPIQSLDLWQTQQQGYQAIPALLLAEEAYNAIYMYIVPASTKCVQTPFGKRCRYNKQNNSTLVEKGGKKRD